MTWRTHGMTGAVGLAFAAWGLLELWILIRNRRGGRGADRGSLLLLFLTIGASISIATQASLAARAPIHPRAVAEVAGAAVMCAGIALRLWAVLTLGAFFRITVTIQEGHRLVDTGPYRRLRHPSYTGMILCMLGMGLGLADWISLGVLAAAAAVGFGWRIRVEEQALARAFPDTYPEYARTRWAVIPYLW